MKAGITFALGVALASAIAGCGSGSDTSPGGSGDTQCFDGKGNASASCALEPKVDTCSLGDANACVPLSTTKVYADDGKNGVCIEVVFDNQCGQEIFADTCIQHQDPGESAPTWQCWTSSVDDGFTIDVSQCHATGEVFTVATKDGGALDIDEMKCPAPTP
ncbi:MAG TPA: hypothetical protein VHB21_13075 [Minicystis sp.]|nr:hypothetical protein [Minicystis sp.]